MSQKKNKARRRAAAREAVSNQSPSNTGASAIDIGMEPSRFQGLWLGWRALALVASRPFASLPMLAGSLVLWVPLAALVANLVAAALFGNSPSAHETGLQMGLMIAWWGLVPVFAATAIETGFLLANRGRIRWRVALACFRCETGIAWVIVASLILGMGLQAGLVQASRIEDQGWAIAATIGLVLSAFIVRIVIFMSTAHLWSGEVGGRSALVWAVRTLPRVAWPWAQGMFVMLFAALLALCLVLALGWLVLVAGAWGGGAQVAASILLLWPVALIALGCLIAMEGRIMLGLHAIAMRPASVEPAPQANPVD